MLRTLSSRLCDTTTPFATKPAQESRMLPLLANRIFTAVPPYRYNSTTMLFAVRMERGANPRSQRPCAVDSLIEQKAERAFWSLSNRQPASAPVNFIRNCINTRATNSQLASLRLPHQSMTGKSPAKVNEGKSRAPATLLPSESLDCIRHRRRAIEHLNGSVF